jgi:rRNA maturation protein Nop10
MDRRGEPTLSCEQCGGAVPLDRAVKLSPVRRQITCPDCGATTEWSIEDPTVIDLRDSRAARSDQAQDDVEAPGSTRRRGRE